MAFHSPFDLYYWFVQTFAGNMTIFLAISFILIASMTAMFRMTGSIAGIMFGLFVILLAAYVGNIYLLIIVVAAIIVGWTLSRLFK